MATSRDFAIDQLRKAGASDIDSIFVAEEGPPIRFENEEFPNTPLNRILVEHPAIMRVSESDPDPDKAQRKTFISRYKLAYQIYRAGQKGVPAGAAKKLVEAGAAMKEREDADRARQAINAGRGATGLNERGKSGSYVSELNSLPGEVSFSSLLS